eukprot:scaffold20074_cov73-Skeletonema_marinoi.AAC.1
MFQVPLPSVLLCRSTGFLQVMVASFTKWYKNVLSSRNGHQAKPKQTTPSTHKSLAKIHNQQQAPPSIQHAPTYLPCRELLMPQSAHWLDHQ